MLPQLNFLFWSIKTCTETKMVLEVLQMIRASNQTLKKKYYQLKFNLSIKNYNNNDANFTVS